MVKLVYHGTDEDFDEFTFEKMGEKSGTDGAGFGLYFSESKGDALGYGDIVYTCMLQLENNLSNEDITIQRPTLKALLDYLDETYDKDYYSLFPKEYDQDEVIDLLLSTAGCDTEIVGDIANSLFGGGQKAKPLMEALSRYGYTHTTDNVTPEDETITHYIVYNLNSITIQDKVDYQLKSDI